MYKDMTEEKLKGIIEEVFLNSPKPERVFTVRTNCKTNGPITISSDLSIPLVLCDDETCQVCTAMKEGLKGEIDKLGTNSKEFTIYFKEGW